MKLKSTLEQWLTLLAVDKAGSIQAASHQLNKSHTTLLYAVKKLESQLDVTLLQLEGRRSVLTPHAKTLLRRAAPMLEQAKDLEYLSTQLSKGMESEIVISMDVLCCHEWLYQPLNKFLATNQATSVKVFQTSLSSTRDVVRQQGADISIIDLPSAHKLAEAFGTVTMIPVVAKTHPLAQKNTICNEDLLTETQIVIRDLGAETAEDELDIGWLKSQQRITLDNFDQAWKAINAGLGFGRIPDHMLKTLDTSGIVRLDFFEGSHYQAPVHICAPKGAKTGLAARQLYEILLADARARLA